MIVRYACLRHAIIIVWLFATVLYNCKSKNDSITSADKQNDEMAVVNKDSEVIGDYDFAVEVADGNLLDAQLGALALTKAINPEVKELAILISSDHGNSNHELRAITHSKNVIFPIGLSRKSQAAYDKLNLKDGDTFDLSYLDNQISTHTGILAKFQREAVDGKDPDIKLFASGKIGVYQQHLKMLRSLQNKLTAKK